jgi:uncharacterized protein (TIGR00645 family)
MMIDFLKRLERVIETLLFSSRWILAPFYLGLAAAMFVLLIKFCQEFWHLATHALSSSESEVIVGMLTLVDFGLTGSLMIIVILSGYENFVSRLDLSRHKDWPAWMGTIDFSALKLKLLSSIVAISAIQLLKYFMNIKNLSDRDLGWAVGIHVVFVVSSVLLALSDRIAGHGNGHEPAAPDDRGGHTDPKTDMVKLAAKPAKPGSKA